MSERAELVDPRRVELDVRAAWIAWMGGRPATTVRARCADLRALGAFLGRSDASAEEIAAQLREVIPSRVRALVAAWTTAQASSGLEGTTIRRRIATVSSWLTELARAGLAVVPELSRPAVATYQRGECPSHARVQLVIAELERAGRIFELAAMLVLADCGLRCAELCSLRVSSLVHGPPPGVSLVRKGGRRVTRTLSNRAYRAIVAALEGRTRGPLLATSRGRAFSASSLAELVASCELGTPHALRRSGATELYHRTRDAELVRQWLDHRNLSTTQIYVRELDDSAGDATRVLAGE